MASVKSQQHDSVNEPQSEPTITEQEIAERAYALYLARGGGDGYDLDDWLQAEQEIRQQHLSAA